MKKYAVFDLDDTLLDFKTQIMIAIQKEFNVRIHWKDWESYDLLSVYDLTIEEIMNAWIKHNCLENAIPLLYSNKILDVAKKMGYEIIIVSARNWHPNAREITEKWLDDYGFTYDELLLVKPSENKMSVLEKYDSFDFVVDDHIKNCIDFDKSGKFNNIFMVDLPWNTNENISQTNIQRIYCLHDILNYLENGV
jgi:FMN phosphatase YigB (HAD superfamily)